LGVDRGRLTYRLVFYLRVEGYVSKPVFVDASEQDVFKKKVSEVAYLLGLRSGMLLSFLIIVLLSLLIHVLVV